MSAPPAGEEEAELAELVGQVLSALDHWKEIEASAREMAARNLRQVPTWSGAEGS